MIAPYDLTDAEHAAARIEATAAIARLIPDWRWRTIRAGLMVRADRYAVTVDAAGVHHWTTEGAFYAWRT